MAWIRACGGGESKSKVLTILDKTNKINLFKDVDIYPNLFNKSGDVDRCSVSSNAIDFYASGAGGSSARAWSNTTFDFKGYKKLYFSGSIEAVSDVSSKVAYCSFGLRKGSTNLISSAETKITKNGQTWSGSIDLTNVDLSSVVSIMIYTHSTYPHYSRIYVNKIWLER